jgi:hypothetical protein
MTFMTDNNATSQWQNIYLVPEIMSDDRFGGGGADDVHAQACDAFKINSESMYEPLWAKYYQGIFRCNMLISKLDKIEWDNQEQRDKVEGEVHFLRGNFYFDLARLFGTAPLVLETAPLNLPRSSADSIFSLIASDLKLAIEKLPAIPKSQISTDDYGRATKWAAQGMMARAFLFYTGYYGKSEMPLFEGGSITKQQVITWVDDCVNKSGHNLISDFRNLWTYSVSNIDYAYAKSNKLHWIGEEGDNIEEIFSWKYCNLASYTNLTLYYGNMLNLYQGWRGQDKVPFGQGWGMGTVNPQLWESWDDNDIRKRGSICNVDDPEEGNINYERGLSAQRLETGYWQKKCMPINMLNSLGRPANYSTVIGNNANGFQLNNINNIIMLRFADVLLMGAELGSSNAQAYFDRVRSRVGLPSLPANLENIKLERRHELAFEGVRYFDLLRWHDAEQALSVVTNVPVRNEGVDATQSTPFRPETGGFLPIPVSQILLSNDVLKQSPGWEGTNINF